MHTNVGGFDRALRLILGIVLISLVFIGPMTAWGWLGLILIASALVGWCPAYTMLGIDTCGSRPSRT